MFIPDPTIPNPLRADADGTIRIGATRVTLDIVVKDYRSGTSVEDIASKYDSLTLATLHVVIGYYLEHQPEIDAYITQRIEATQRIQQQWNQENKG